LELAVKFLSRNIGKCDKDFASILRLEWKQKKKVNKSNERLTAD
jgi:hypothetical protein